jgi:hypothetical protein
MFISQLASQPVHVKYLKWGAWVLLIGVVIILVNLLLIYIFVQYTLVPFLARGGSFQHFEQLILPRSGGTSVNKTPTQEMSTMSVIYL